MDRVGESDHIVVTGGAGFIGSHLVDQLLTQGASVTAIDNFSDYYSPERKRDNLRDASENPRFRLIEGDAGDKKILAAALEPQTRYVFHLAAEVGVMPSFERPMDYQKSNVEMTRTILSMLESRPETRMVFTSSSAVYGASRSDPLREDSPVQPLSPYGESKLNAELLARSFTEFNGVDAVTVRLFTVYGPRVRPDMALWKFTESILKKRALELRGSGRLVRDFTWVGDAIRGLLRIAAEGERGDVINISGGSPIAVGRFAALIAEALGEIPDVEDARMHPGEMDRTRADLTRARRIGWRPKVPIRDGINVSVAWIRDQLQEPGGDD